MKVECAKCKEPVDMPDIPQPQIFGRPDVSVVIVQHPRTGYCFNCKERVALHLAKIDLGMTAKSIEPLKPPSPLVIAPASALLKMKA